MKHEQERIRNETCTSKLQNLGNFISMTSWNKHKTTNAEKPINNTMYIPNIIYLCGCA